MGAQGSKQLLADLEKLRRNDPATTSLSYDSSQLGDDGAKVLARALSSNHVLRRLQLGGCNLSAVGLLAVSRSLCEDRIVPSRIRKLDLVGSDSNYVHALSPAPLFVLFCRVPANQPLTGVWLTQPSNTPL